MRHRLYLECLGITRKRHCHFNDSSCEVKWLAAIPYVAVWILTNIDFGLMLVCQNAIFVQNGYVDPGTLLGSSCTDHQLTN